jgi:hypothetical protein
MPHPRGNPLPLRSTESRPMAPAPGGSLERAPRPAPPREGRFPPGTMDREVRISSLAPASRCEGLPAAVARKEERPGRAHASDG